MTEGVRSRMRAALSLGRFDQVEELARTGLRSEPHDGEFLVMLAVAIGERPRGRGEDKEVRTLVRSAVAADSEDPWLLRTAAIALARIDDRRDAVQLIERSIVLDPNDATGHAMLAEQLVHVASSFGRKPDTAMVRRAMEHARIAIRLDPQDPFGFLAASRASLANNDIYTCRRYAREALAREPDHPVGHQLLGLAAELDGNVRAASSHYVAAGRADPTSDTPIKRLRGLRGLRRVGCAGVIVFWLVLRGLILVGESSGVSSEVMGWIAITILFLFVAFDVMWPRIQARRQLTREARQVLDVDRKIRRGRRFRRR